MAGTRTLLSVADFARLPAPAGGVRQELHHGELFELPPVKKLHTLLQKRLVTLLEVRIDPALHAVDKEFPFRPAPENEVWIADVAVYGVAAWEKTPEDDYFRGAPAIVIEVLSASNSASEMLEREEVCLRHGGREFWMVDPQRESVKIVRVGGHSHTYGVDGIVESSELRESLPVREIFAR